LEKDFKELSNKQDAIVEELRRTRQNLSLIHQRIDNLLDLVKPLCADEFERADKYDNNIIPLE